MSGCQNRPSFHRGAAQYSFTGVSDSICGRGWFEDPFSPVLVRRECPYFIRTNETTVANDIRYQNSGQTALDTSVRHGTAIPSKLLAGKIVLEPQSGVYPV
jgi:hypothetical protein